MRLLAFLKGGERLRMAENVGFGGPAIATPLVHIHRLSPHTLQHEAMSAPAGANGSGKPEMTLTVLGCGRNYKSLNAIRRC